MKSIKAPERKDNIHILERALNEVAYEITAKKGTNGILWFLKMCIHQARSNVNMQSTIIRHILGQAAVIDNPNSKSTGTIQNITVQVIDTHPKSPQENPINTNRLHNISYTTTNEANNEAINEAINETPNETITPNNIKKELPNIC